MHTVQTGETSNLEVEHRTRVREDPVPNPRPSAKPSRRRQKGQPVSNPRASKPCVGIDSIHD